MVELQKQSLITFLKIRLFQDEWKGSQCGDIPNEYFKEDDIYKDGKFKFKNHLVDHIWRYRIKIKDNFGKRRYVMLPDLIKSALRMQSGNTKHSLSSNGNDLTKERTSMTEETIVGVRRVKENFCINKSPENIIVTNSMISTAQNVDGVC